MFSIGPRMEQLCVKFAEKRDQAKSTSLKNYIFQSFFLSSLKQTRFNINKINQ